MNVAAGKQQAVERAGIWLLKALATPILAGWAMQIECVGAAIPRCQANKAVDSMSDEWGKTEKRRRGFVARPRHLSQLICMAPH